MKKRRTKQEKGAITLYVLVSMLFFSAIVTGIYVDSSNKVQKQQEEEKRIETEYKQTEDIDEIYEKTYDDYVNTETPTIQVYENNDTLKTEVIGEKVSSKKNVYVANESVKLKFLSKNSSDKYAYSTSENGTKTKLEGNTLELATTTEGKTVYVYIVDNQGNYSKYYTAVTIILVELQDKTIYVEEGKTVEIGEIQGAEAKDITFGQIEDSSVINLEENKVTGLIAGETTLIATERKSGATATITVKVVKIELAQVSGLVLLGNSKTVQVTGINNGNLTAKTSDENVATATINNNEMIITSKGAGNATITVTESNAQATATYEISVISVTLNPNGGTYAMPTGATVATVKTTVTTENADKIETAWSDNAGDWKEISDNEEMIKDDCASGDYYLYVRVNEQEIYKSKEFKVGLDTDVESKITITPDKTGWSSTDVTATITYGSTLTSNKKAGFASTLAEAKLAANTDTATSVVATETGYFYAEATDIAGNKVIASLQVFIDKTAPSAPEITSKINDVLGETYTSETWTNQNVYVELKSTDNIEKYEYSHNGTNWTSNAVILTNEIGAITFTAERDNIVYFRAVDRAGNVSESSTLHIRIDKTAPTVPEITAKINDSSGETYTSGTWTNQNIYIELKSTNNIERYELSHDGEDWISGVINVSNGVGTVTFTAERNNVVRFRAIDKAGNISEESTIDIKIDKSAPSAPTITAKYNDDSGDTYISGTWTNQNVFIKMESTDNIDRYEYSHDGSTWTSNLLTLTNGVATGTLYSQRNNTVGFRAIDKAGNISEVSTINVKIDKTLPTVTIDLNGGDYKISVGETSTTIQTQVTTTDTGGSGFKTLQYAWSTDNNTSPTSWTDFTNGTSISKTNCTQGIYYLWLNIVDGAGNICETKVSNAFNVYIAPTITQQPQSVTIKDGETATFTTAATGGNPNTYTYQWYKNNGKVADGYSGFKVTKMTETEGDFYRASFSKTSGTDSTWYYIRFTPYAFETNKTYRIHIKIRMQSVTNGSGSTIRHSAIGNDYATEGKKQVEFESGTNGEWVEYTLDRSFTDTVTQGSTTYTTNPRIEIYTGNLKLTDTITSRELTFDYKDVYVEEVDTGKIVMMQGIEVIDGATSATYSNTGTTDIDGTQYYCEINNGKYSLMTDAATLSVLGKPQVSLKLNDASGDTYTSGSWTNQNIYHTVTCEGADIAKYQYSHDNATWNDIPSSWQLTKNGNTLTYVINFGGQWDFYIRGVDASGNVTASSDKFTERIDKTLPTVTLSPNGGTYTIPTSANTATIKTTLTAEDAGGSGLKTLQYAWSTSDIEEPSNWTDFTNESEVSKADCTAGTYYLWTNVIDNTTNVATNVKTSNAFTVKANTDAESKITITPNKTGWSSTDVTATITYGSTLTANKKAGFGTNLVTAKSTASTNTATSVTATETGYFYAEATDAAGNKVTASLQVLIDKTAPSVPTITATLDSATGETYTPGVWTSKTVYIELSSTDSMSGVKEYQWYSDGAWTTSWLTTENGKGTMKFQVDRNEVVKYRVVDNAGNVSSESTIDVKIDKSAPSAPTITATYNDASGDAYTSGTWTNQNVFIKMESTDNIDKYQYSHDGSAWTSAGLTLADGVATGTFTSERNNVVRFRAIDKAGNISEESTIDIKIDKTAPEAPMITAKINDTSGDAYTSGTWTNQNVFIKMESADNIDKYQYSHDGTTWTSAALTLTNGIGTVTFTSARNNTVRFRAIDKAGNISEESTIIIRIDKTLPTVKLNPNGGTYTIPTSLNTATIKTTLTAEDTGGSGLKTLQYAWSTSNTTVPTDWTTFTSGNEVSKTDCTAGIYYLWTNVIDNATNVATSVRTSSAFTVKANTDTTAKIQIDYNPTTYTNENVTGTVTYGSTLTANKKAGFGTTLANAKNAASASTATTLTATSNGYFYAEATDSAGNLITKSLQITNIDSNPPVINTDLTSSDVTYKKCTLTVNVTDSLSGLSKIIWYYKLSSASNYTAVTDVYTQMNGSTKGTTTAITKSKEITDLTYGVYTAYAEIYDVAGNKKTSSTIQIDTTIQIGDYVDYDISYVDNYSGYSFTKTNGWRVLDPDGTDDSGNAAVKLVSTGIPTDFIYYYNTIKQVPHFTTLNSTTYQQKYASKFYSSGNLTNANMAAASGLYYLFENIPFASTNNYLSLASNINGAYVNTDGSTEASIFKTGSATKVHALTFTEINKARNAKAGEKQFELVPFEDGGSGTTFGSTITTANDAAPGLFVLNDLNKFNWNSSSDKDYYLASPFYTANSSNTAYYDLFIINSDGSSDVKYNEQHGVRVVVTIPKEDFDLEKMTP